MVLSHPDYRIGNRPRTAKFKAVRNVSLLTSYSIDLNLQDELAGQDGVRKWMICKLTEEDLQEINDNKGFKQTKSGYRKECWNI